jgi:hypothetical protein
MAGYLRRQAKLRTAACALALVGGCLEESRYHVVQEQVELTADTPPAYVTEDDEEVFRVDRAFALRITAPSQAALAQLTRDAPGRTTNYPRLPWVSLHDLELQLDYAITNASEEPITAMVTLNGVNEFQYYAPGPENLHQWERRIALAPRQRVTGTVTELEMDEIAIDLATVVNGAPNSNLVVDRNSQSGRDPRVSQYVPRVVPGLVGVRAGIESMRAAPVVLEVFIRVQDHEDRAQPRGEASWQLPEAAPFTPIVPEE